MQTIRSRAREQAAYLKYPRTVSVEMTSKG